ncbi:unnamed protein product, partial [Rotaria socialis]
QCNEPGVRTISNHLRNEKPTTSDATYVYNPGEWSPLAAPNRSTSYRHVN